MNQLKRIRKGDVMSESNKKRYTILDLDVILSEIDKNQKWLTADKKRTKQLNDESSLVKEEEMKGCYITYEQIQVNRHES